MAILITAGLNQDECMHKFVFEDNMKALIYKHVHVVS